MKRRDIFILILVWSTAGLLVLIAIFLYLAQTQRTQEGPAPVEALAVPTLPADYQVNYNEYTALNLYPLAEAAARQWQTDVQLVSVEATWNTTAIDKVGNPTPWTFRFYSPSAERTYFVIALPDGRINARQHFLPEPDSPPLVPVPRWTVDSNQAISVWLNAGGGRFLGENPGMEVSAILRYQDAVGTPLWEVNGLTQDHQIPVVVTVDAQSGALVQ